MTRFMPRRLILVIACALPVCACMESTSRSVSVQQRETVRVPVKPASGGGARQASTLILGVQ